MNTHHLTNRSQAGFTLIEVMVSILIFSIGVVALVGMQTLMISNSIDAENRIQASYFANQLIGQMWVDRKANPTDTTDANLNTYDTIDGGSRPTGHYLDAWLNNVQAVMPGATGANAPTVSVTGNRVDITIRWQLPSDSSTHAYSTTAVITSAE